ncbi:MAG: ATP-dependent Clp protease proteolytic subunit [Nanoarchaeota archaeon]
MKNSNNECNDEGLICNDYVHITNYPTIINNYSIYLTDEIVEGKYYRELLNILRQAKENDTLNIYLNNDGGDVHTSIDIINAMNTTLGNIITHITGPIYSAASLIALHGHKINVHNNTFVMFHDYSGKTVGKGNEQETAIRNDKPWFDKFFTTTVNKFLTKRETKSILKGIDLYLGSEEVKERLKKIGKLYE